MQSILDLLLVVALVNIQEIDVSVIADNVLTTDEEQDSRPPIVDIAKEQIPVREPPNRVRGLPLVIDTFSNRPIPSRTISRQHIIVAI